MYHIIAEIIINGIFEIQRGAKFELGKPKFHPHFDFEGDVNVMISTISNDPPLNTLFLFESLPPLVYSQTAAVVCYLNLWMSKDRWPLGQPKRQLETPNEDAAHFWVEKEKQIEDRG